MTASWWQAAGGSGGAIAVYGVCATNAKAIDAAIASLTLEAMSVGSVRLCRVDEVDDLVVARPAEQSFWLMPHAGVEIAKRVERWLLTSGIKRLDVGESVSRFPEATSPMEARVLETLSRAYSPRAVDLLLRQPHTWALGQRLETEAPDARDRGLQRLIDTPLVVAVGRPNAGKSTLLNALAGRSVALASSVPGTTLDHVGARIEVDGLVVRWVDTPGMEAQPQSIEQHEAQHLARALAHRADLIVVVSEASGQGQLSDLPDGGCMLVVATKADLWGGKCPSWADCAVSAEQGDGLDALAKAVRLRLVPDAWLDDPRPWRFWRG